MDLRLSCKLLFTTGLLSASLQTSYLMKLQNAMSSITIKIVYQLLFFIHVLTFVCTH